MKKFSRFLTQALPWGVAAVILGYLFHHYPPKQVWASLRYVKLLPFFGFAVGYFFFIFFVDAWVMQRVIVRFSHHASLRDILMARGATYLIMVVSYPASQAAFAYYLKRRYRIPIFECFSIFLFITIIDLLWIITLAFVGSFTQTISIGPLDLRHTVQTVAAGTFIFLVLWLAFWRRWPEKLFGMKHRFGFLERLRGRGIFYVFNRATVFDYLRVAVMRIPIHFTIIVSMYVVVLTFQTHVPFEKILGNMPLCFLIGTLPITPGGLGTVNAAIVELLSPYMQSSIFAEGQITAKDLMFTITLLWMFTNYLLKVITGILCLSRVSKNLFRPPTGDATNEPQELPPILPQQV